MTTLREGEIEFVFGDAWRAEKFDRRGVRWPKGISPVDFVVEGKGEIVLLEVKDPSAARATPEQRQRFAQDMQTRTLVHEGLVPKARSSYGFLHLMARDTKPMRFVVVIGVESLSIEPLLIEQLADRLRRRVKTEAPEPWKREYVAACTVVPPPDLGKALPGCSARRIPGAALSRGKDL